MNEEELQMLAKFNFEEMIDLKMLETIMTDMLRG